MSHQFFLCIFRNKQLPDLPTVSQGDVSMVDFDHDPRYN